MSTVLGTTVIVKHSMVQPYDYRAYYKTPLLWKPVFGVMSLSAQNTSEQGCRYCYNAAQRRTTNNRSNTHDTLSSKTSW